MTHQCLGCKKSWQSNKALSAHKKQCPAYKIWWKTQGSNKVEPTPENDENPAVAHDHEGTASLCIESPSGSNMTLETGTSARSNQLKEFPSQLPRNRTLPRRTTSHIDILPPSLPPFPGNSTPPSDALNATSDRSQANAHVGFCTGSNDYGVYRVYKGGKPSYVPPECPLESLADSPNFHHHPLKVVPPDNHVPDPNDPSPFPNMSIKLLMEWHYNGTSTKSYSDLNALVNLVFKSGHFKVTDFENFDAARMAKILDDYKPPADKTNSPGSPHACLKPEDGWIETSVPIRLPPPNRGSHGSENDAPTYDVPGLFYRNTLEVIKTAFEEPAATTFHIEPFEEYWQPSPDSPPERIISEIYNSDEFNKEYAEIRANKDSSCDLETVIAPVLIWSDSTHLATFGNASLWPVYIYLGNQSKYTRGKPSSFSAHHTAYIPKLDDAIQDFYKNTFGVSASAEVLTHLRCELMQEVMALILDDKLMDAYVKGIIIKFPDGIERRLFIRFYIYAADYPEKVLLSGIKYLGEHPCPRCLIQKCDIHKLGTVSDMKRRETHIRLDNQHRRDNVETARKWIYSQGYKVNSQAVQRLLGPKSLVPTRNTFSERLSPHGVNFHEMFVPDLLHEFELGVWKATFTHMIRLLLAMGEDKVQIFNQRFRQIPTFGRDTIRKFSKNVLDMKQLAARDFEDMLQCCIPVFEGLFEDKDEGIVQDLLFELATWHGLAKLRLHTTRTINELDRSTTRLGLALRRFQSITCKKYVTKDLPSEAAARGRRKIALAKKTASVKGKGTQKAMVTNPQERKFNLSTYKTHALGDYAAYIRRFGTTDNFTTSLGELEHRRCKRFWPRIHKGRYTVGIAKHVRRERLLHNMRNRGYDGRASRKRRRTRNTRIGLDFSEHEYLPPSDPSEHYQMSHETRHPVELSTWLGDNKDDPALTNFMDQLKDHLLSRVLNQSDGGDDVIFSDEDRLSLSIVGGCIYQHKVLRVNYTSYDMRRGQDSLNPRTQANVILLSHSADKEKHPYWYTRILGVYHIVVQHSSLLEPMTIDFLWVRWYGLDPVLNHKYGWKHRRMYRIGFVPHDIDEETGLSPAFGFINPLDVIRGIHLIPGYHHGTTLDDLPPSRTARLESENDEDWNFYYVNFFADRDHVMRYRGGGVGHKSTREATNTFLKDRRKEDLPENSTEPQENVQDGMEDCDDEQEEAEGEGNDEREDEEMEDCSDGEELSFPNSDDEILEDDTAADGTIFEEDCDYDYGIGLAEESDMDAGNISDDQGSDSADDALGAEDGYGSDEMEECGYAEL